MLSSRGKRGNWLYDQCPEAGSIELPVVDLFRALMSIR